MTARLSQLGTAAWLLDAGTDTSLETQRRIWQAAKALRAWPDVQEAVPCVGNLLVVLRYAQEDAAEVGGRLLQLWRETPAQEVKGRRIVIPVIYGGSCLDDLLAVSEQTGLSPQDVAALHASTAYDVYAIASSPGYAYLFGVDPRLAVPRKARPSLNVPANNVGIAGRQTGVTVVAGPNGWHNIGTADVRMFDLAREPPCLLRTGDTVQFAVEAVRV